MFPDLTVQPILLSHYHPGVLVRVGDARYESPLVLYAWPQWSELRDFDYGKIPRLGVGLPDYSRKGAGYCIVELLSRQPIQRDCCAAQAGSIWRRGV